MSNESSRWLQFVYELITSRFVILPWEVLKRLATDAVAREAFKQFESHFPEQARYVKGLFESQSTLSSVVSWVAIAIGGGILPERIRPQVAASLADFLVGLRRLALEAETDSPDNLRNREERIKELISGEPGLIVELTSWLGSLAEEDRALAIHVLATMPGDEIRSVLSTERATRLQSALIVRALLGIYDVSQQRGENPDEVLSGLSEKLRNAAREESNPRSTKGADSIGSSRRGTRSTHAWSQLYDRFSTVCRALFTKAGQFSSSLLREIRDKGGQLLRFLVAVALLLVLVPPILVGLGVLFQNDFFFFAAGIFSFLALALLLMTFYPLIALLQVVFSRREKEGIASNVRRPAERYLNVVLSLLLLDGLMTLYAMIFPVETQPYFILLLGICLLMLIALSFRYQEGLGRILRVLSAVVICVLFIATSFALTFPKTARSLKQTLGRIDLAAGTTIGESILGPNFDSLGIGRVLVAFTPDGWVQFPVDANLHTDPKSGIPLDTMTREIYDFIAREKAGERVRYYFESEEGCRVYERPGYTRNVDESGGGPLTPVIGRQMEMRADSCLAEMRAREIHQAESIKAAQEAAARAIRRQLFMANPNPTATQAGRGIHVFSAESGSEVIETDIQRAVIQGLNTQGVKVSAALTTEASDSAWGTQLIQGKTAVLNSLDFFGDYKELWVFQVIDATAEPRSGQRWNCKGSFHWGRLTLRGGGGSGGTVKIPGSSRSEASCLNQLRQTMVDSMVAVVTRFP